MTGPDPRSLPPSDRSSLLNAALGIGAESVLGLAEVMLLPSLVLAFFVAELTPSYPTIGLVPALVAALWTTARLPAIYLTATQRRVRPWAFATALIRAGAIGVLAVVASRTDPISLAQSGRPLLITFFLCLIVFAVAGGLGSAASAALLRPAVVNARWPALSFQRAAIAMLLALLGALIAARILGSAALTFPGNYGRLFLIATICLLAVAVLLVALREPAPFALPNQTLPLRAIAHPLQDRRYTKFLVFRMLLSATAIVDPFLFLYAVTRLGIPVTALGGYVVAAVIGWIVATPIWQWMERRSGPRSVLQASAVLRLIAPTIALALPQIFSVAQVNERFAVATQQTTLFGLAFLAIGAAMAAQSFGNDAYLTPLAQRNLLPAFSGLTNAVLAVVAFAPVLGGLVIQRYSYELLFGLTVAIALLAVFAGGWLTAILPQHRQRRTDLAVSPTDIPALRTEPF